MAVVRVDMLGFKMEELEFESESGRLPSKWAFAFKASPVDR